MDPTERVPELFNQSLAQLYYYVVLIDLLVLYYGMISLSYISDLNSSWLFSFEMLFFICISFQLCYGLKNLFKGLRNGCARSFKAHAFLKLNYCCLFLLRKVLLFPIVCRLSDEDEISKYICSSTSMFGIFFILLWVYIQSICLRLITKIADSYEFGFIGFEPDISTEIELSFCDEIREGESVEIEGVELQREFECNLQIVTSIITNDLKLKGLYYPDNSKYEKVDIKV